MADQLMLQDNQKRTNLFIGLFAFGMVGLLGGLGFLPMRTWVMILTANFFFFALGIFGTFFLAITYTIRASFVVPYRRVLDALAATVPYFSTLMLTCLLGAKTLYEWTDPYKIANDPILQTKLAYLNMPFFSFRMIVAIAIFTFISTYLVKWSRKQDEASSEQEAIAIDEKLKSVSAVSLVVLSLTLSMATFDWIMSLHSHWYSTIYGVLALAGALCSGVAFSILVLNYLQNNDYLTNKITDDHYHDLGKFLFGFCTFWAYIWYSQYLLIWYANIPEAAEYFYIRDKDGWTVPFWSVVIINWLIPFLLLLPRAVKRNRALLSKVCWIVLFGQLFNLYVMVAPKIYLIHGDPGPKFGFPEIVVPFAYLGAFLWVYFKSLQRAPLIPQKSPHLEEGLALHQ